MPRVALVCFRSSISASHPIGVGRYSVEPCCFLEGLDLGNTGCGNASEIGVSLVSISPLPFSLPPEGWIGAPRSSGAATEIRNRGTTEYPVQRSHNQKHRGIALKEERPTKHANDTNGKIEEGTTVAVQHSSNEGPGKFLFRVIRGLNRSFQVYQEVSQESSQKTKDSC